LSRSAYPNSPYSSTPGYLRIFISRYQTEALINRSQETTLYGELRFFKKKQRVEQATGVCRAKQGAQGKGELLARTEWARPFALGCVVFDYLSFSSSQAYAHRDSQKIKLQNSLVLCFWSKIGDFSKHEVYYRVQSMFYGASGRSESRSPTHVLWCDWRNHSGLPAVTHGPGKSNVRQRLATCFHRQTGLTASLAQTVTLFFRLLL
jgi:hypothetical protein